MSAFVDDDRWDELKYLDCDCGHSRTRHAFRADDTHCTATRVSRRQPPDLPKPVYAAGVNPESPFEWPVNWPAPSEWPKVAEPCPCKKFYEAEPPEPDYWEL